MKLLKGIVDKLKKANDSADVVSIARDCHIEMTEEEAATCFAQLNGSELDDEAVVDVAGGLVQLVNPSSSRL